MYTICTRLALPLIVKELPQLHGTGRNYYSAPAHAMKEHKKNKIYTFQNFPFHFNCRVITDSDAVY